MKNGRTVLNIYVAILVVYSILRFVITGPIINIFRFVLVAWSFYYFFKAVFNFVKEPVFIKMLILLYLIFAVYGFAIIYEGKSFYVTAGLGHKVPNFLYLFNVSKSLLPIFAFYHFSKIGVLTQEYMKRRIWLFLITAGLIFLLKFQQGQMIKESDDFTNNAGYTVLSLMPMLVFLKDRSLKQYLSFLVCIILIFMAMKRGAIICMFLVVLIYLYSLFFRFGKKKVFSLILALALLGFLSYSVFEKMITNSEHMQKRVEDTVEGESSGRDVYYLFFLNYYVNQTTPQEFVFGRGANGTLEIWSNYAHNDWLEIAINQGMLGLVSYLIFWLSFFYVCMKKKNDPKLSVVLWMLFVIYFLKTMFSMSYDQYTLFSSMTLGYCIACSYPKKSLRLFLRKENRHEIL